MGRRVNLLPEPRARVQGAQEREWAVCLKSGSARRALRSAREQYSPVAQTQPTLNPEPGEYCSRAQYSPVAQTQPTLNPEPMLRVTASCDAARDHRDRIQCGLRLSNR